MTLVAVVVGVGLWLVVRAIGVVEHYVKQVSEDTIKIAATLESIQTYLSMIESNTGNRRRSKAEVDDVIWSDVSFPSEGQP